MRNQKILQKFKITFLINFWVVSLPKIDLNFFQNKIKFIKLGKIWFSLTSHKFSLEMLKRRKENYHFDKNICNKGKVPTSENVVKKSFYFFRCFVVFLLFLKFKKSNIFKLNWLSNFIMFSHLFVTNFHL